MNILELDSYNLGDAVKFNKQLNPKIWSGETMRPEVREKLLAIADDFKEFLGLEDINVKDVTVSGSNANYSYTPYSDIDLHLVVDIPQADSNEVYRELFDAKKYQYNDLHDFKIGRYDVELYVENANEPPVSKGVYSLLNNDWINIPRRVRSSIDDDAVRSKYEDIKHRIDNAISSDDSKLIDQLATKIKNMRQAGLDAHGELGPENLAYKMLRTQGKIKQLYDARNTAKDKELSLKEKAVDTQRVTYGFKTPTVEDVGMSWDGVSPTTKMFASEDDQTQTDEEVLKDFIQFCVKELKIDEMPVVKLRKDPQWSVVNKTFGRYINEKRLLEVAWGQRHIMDVLRTVAHELTHKHQHERDGEQMGPDAGETGSPYENEANARAGILMRDYGRLHPDLFDAGEMELEESASGYIPTKKQARDPRFSMALTQDIKPGQLGREANKLKLKTNSQGAPQIANPNGLFEKLSLELSKFKKGLADEDYSPDTPPGPEFKPSMPAGTLRVDVSDVYDWYKLGNHISNMKGLGKHDFGAGPPSTIVSFGDEDTEHEFIGDLEATGLDVTDIDPKDPKRRPGKQIKTDPTYNVNESEQLDEVSMRPSTLKQFAMSPEAEGIQAGFEAELIFRDTVNDEDGGDMEPDYDADERVYGIDDVIDFFNNGEYGGLSQREEDRLRDKLNEAYYEWYDNQMYESWQDNQDEPIRDAHLEDRPMDERIHDALVDGLGLTDEQADAVEALHARRGKGEIKGSDMSEEELDMAQQYSEARSIAEDILDEDVEQSIKNQDAIYDSALDDFRDNFLIDDDNAFFSDVGWRWMSDIANEFGLDWPYLQGGSNGGSRDWDSIGDSLNQWIDMPVKVSSGYHSATRKPGLWIVEPDSSLEPDDREDYGLEIVSPPMPLAQALEKLEQVTEWANSNDGDAYTNSSTGLHMGVSIPFKEGRVDYLKLILFLGDEYVLKQYGREANTYTKAAMKEIRQRAGTEKNATAVMELLKNNLLELAERELAKNTGEGKYTSAHKQGKYIEFRSAGGDWLAEANAEPGKLENTMMRYAYAMYLAGRPDLERGEYAKKLYKLVSPEGDSSLALFSQYAAGEIDKDRLKKRWAEKTLSKEQPKGSKKSNWKLYNNGTRQPVQGQEYNGYTYDEARAKAKEKISPASSDRDFDQAYTLRDVGEGSNQWRVYRADTGETLEIINAEHRGEAVDDAYEKYSNVIPFKVEPYNPDQPAKELSPRAKLAKRITTQKQQPRQTVDTAPSNWEFFYEPTGRVLDAVSGITTTQARAVLADVQRRYDDLSASSIKMRKADEASPDVEQNFGPSTNPRPTIQEPEQMRMPNGMPVWEVVDRSTGSIINQLADHTQREANSRMLAWLQSIGAEDPASYGERFIVRPKMNTVSENFADGKGPGRPGDSQRHGIPKGSTIAQLEKAAKAPGRKGQLARWQLNMRRGKKK